MTPPRSVEECPCLELLKKEDATKWGVATVCVKHALAYAAEQVAQARERCAEIAFNMKPRIPYSGDSGYQGGHNEACEDIAAAIRRGEG